MLNPLNLLSKIIKSPNQREIERLKKIVSKVNNLEQNYKTLKNDTECRFTVQDKFGLRRGSSGNWHNRPEGCFLHHNRFMSRAWASIGRTGQEFCPQGSQ